jgi:hypothetical protein
MLGLIAEAEKRVRGAQWPATAQRPPGIEHFALQVESSPISGLYRTAPDVAAQAKAAVAPERSGHLTCPGLEPGPFQIPAF